MRPTFSQLSDWDIEGLTEASHSLLEDVNTLADRIATAGPAVQHSVWQGDAYLSALSASDERIDIAEEVQDQWTEVIDQLSTAAVELHWAREYCLTTKGDAEGAGLNVADDGTVTPGENDDDEILKHHQDRINNALDDLDAADIAQADALRQSAETLGRITGAGGPSFISLPGRKEVDPDSLISGWEQMSPDAIAKEIEQLSQSDRQLLITSSPWVVGATDGVPWDMRFEANRINIRSSLISEEKSVSPDKDKIKIFESMLAYHDDPATAAKPMTGNGKLDSATNDLVARQFLKFDPYNGQGRTIEFLGNMDSNTDNVAVFVPGTGASMSSADTYRDRAREIVEDSNGRSAALVWQDADFPDTVAKDAPFSHYATDGAPNLVGFSQELTRNIDSSDADPTITYVAHSYGGAILGTADASGGFYADREILSKQPAQGSTSYQRPIGITSIQTLTATV